MNWDLSKYKNQTDWSSKNLILIGEFHKSLKTKGKSFLLELSTKARSVSGKQIAFKAIGSNNHNVSFEKDKSYIVYSADGPL